MRSASPRTLPVGLAIAFALHALGLATVALVQHQLPYAAPATALAPAEPLTWFERTDEPQPDARARPEVAAAARPSPGERLARAVTPRRSSSGPRDEPAGPSSEEVTDDNEAGSDEAGLTASREPAPAAGGGKPLSLDQLGVGSGHNPFIGPPSGQRHSANTLGERIDHVLRSALAEHDRKLGLGPEGPVVAAVLDLVMQSSSAPNTDALLVLRTNGDGETVHVEVAEANGDTDAWNAIARSLLKALQGKKLRVPPRSGGVTMQLRVDSRNALPSGRDPGLAVDLFGLEVKPGDGPKSTRLSLLTPHIVLEQYQLSSTDPHATKPAIRLDLTILGVAGDLVDIGAVSRRVVHAHLVSLETHPRAPEQ